LTGNPDPAVTGTATTTCAIGTCGLVWVEGPDAASFLHGLVTCSVTDQAVGEGRLALLLDAKGHIGAQLQIVRDAAASFTLITDPDAAASLVEDLERFHFSEDLEILGPEPSAQLTLAADQAPPGAALAAPGWTPGTWTLVADDPLVAAAQLGCTPTDAEALERLRIRAGVARVGTDTGPKTLVQEARFEDRAVDFTKGCYLGQETVARAQHRGQVHRTLRGVVAQAPLPVGAEVHYDGRAIGAITSTAADPELGTIALGILRRDVPDGAAVSVGPGAVPATVRPLPLR
jgi:folate-binding protein YgfZ